MKKIASLPFFILIVLTVISILSTRKEMTQYFLTPVTTASGGITRTDYVDENGQITFAADLGYATVIRTCEDDKVILEEYFDENGRPAVLWNFASAVSYSYNEEGQAEWLHYLDGAGQPVVISDGYSSLHRTYTDEGAAHIDTYFIGKKQVACINEYYAYERSDFDENGRPTQMTYLDRSGNPVVLQKGFSTIRRDYYGDTWHVRSDRYFDASGAPAMSADGCCGYLHEYDDQWREIRTMYLDADGNPVNSKYGYAVIKTVYENPSVKNFYFDKDGNPATGDQNQYGTETVGGQTFSLNADGSRMLRIDFFLQNSPLIVLIFGSALTILTQFLKKKGRLCMLILNLAAIFTLTLLFRKPGAAGETLLGLDAIKRLLSNAEIRREVINNIWLFVPLGAALYQRGSRRWLIPIAVSVLVETAQLAFGTGTFEAADLICNSLGGFIGYAMGTGPMVLKRPEGQVPWY